MFCHKLLKIVSAFTSELNAIITPNLFLTVDNIINSLVLNKIKVVMNNGEFRSWFHDFIGDKREDGVDFCLNYSFYPPG